MTNYKKSPLALAASAALAAMAALCLPTVANAGETIDLGNGLKLDWRLGTTYTLATRVENRDPLLSGANNAGGNDGNNNFSKGALTANRLAALLETKLTKGDSGLVISASTFYDDVYHGKTDNKFTVNQPQPASQFNRQTERFHGGYSRMLDVYGFTSIDTGAAGRLNLKLGRHVVSWGEALFFPGISLAQGPADGTKTGVVGTETKDQLLPEDQFSATLEVNTHWTVMGHAQFNFHETLSPAPGSFLSTGDSSGPGASCLGPYTAIPAIPTMFAGFNGCSFGLRGEDIRPKKTGQWGLGTRYRISDETELGFYYLNYHDRTPLPEINAVTLGSGVAIPPALRPAFGGITQIGNGTYRVRYFDDVKLLGASFSTTFGSVAVGGEISHKQGAPVLVDAVVNPATGATLTTPTRADITQVNLNAFYNIGRTPLADGANLLGEIVYVKVGGVEARKAIGTEAFPANFGFTASDKLAFGTDHGLAVSGTLALSYPGVFEGWDLSVPISASYQIKGRTLLGGVGGEGDGRFSLGATFTKGGNFSVGASYQGYAGSASLHPTKNRQLTDRDQFSLVMKYAF